MILLDPGAPALPEILSKTSETSKISVRKKRIRAALNDDFRDKILMGQ